MPDSLRIILAAWLLASCGCRSSAPSGRPAPTTPPPVVDPEPAAPQDVAWPDHFQDATCTVVCEGVGAGSAELERFSTRFSQSFFGDCFNQIDPGEQAAGDRNREVFTGTPGVSPDEIDFEITIHLELDEGDPPPGKAGAETRIQSRATITMVGSDAKGRMVYRARILSHQDSTSDGLKGWRLKHAGQCGQRLAFTMLHRLASMRPRD